MQKVGVIGLGLMGAEFAKQLAAAGFRVLGWNRSAIDAEPLTAAGVMMVEQPQDVFAADIVLSMLSDDAAYRALFIDSGLLAELPADKTHVVMATISPDFSEQFAALHTQHGLRYVAAPVLGNSRLAAAGKVHVLASGDAQAVELVRPVLTELGSSFRVLGGAPGQAHTAKLAVNLLLNNAVQALAESLALVNSAGLASDQFVELITHTMFSGPAYQTYGETMRREQYEPAAFALAMGAKDVGLALDVAESQHVSLPLTQQVQHCLQEAINAGLGEQDLGALRKQLP